MSSPLTRIEGRGKPGAAIIARLEALRDAHRLGIHMWERNKNLTYPETDTPAKPHPSDALFSMSLIPSARSPYSLKPFGVASRCNLEAGYLVDLDTGQEHPPRVMQVSSDNLQSGDTPYTKKLKLRLSNNDMPALRSLYAPHEHREQQDYIAFIHGEQGLAFCDRQLDALGQAMDDPSLLGAVGEYIEHYRDPRPGDRKKVIHNNEVIASCDARHVRAIVLPVMSLHGNAWYASASRLTAALAGLDHLDHQDPLPVVMYHVDGTRGGQFEYVGEGREELMKVARASFSDLMQDIDKFIDFRNNINHHSKYAWDDYVKSVNKHLGIDISEPVFAVRIQWKDVGTQWERGV